MFRSGLLQLLTMGVWEVTEAELLVIDLLHLLGLVALLLHTAEGLYIVSDLSLLPLDLCSRHLLQQLFVFLCLSSFFRKLLHAFLCSGHFLLLCLAHVLLGHFPRFLAHVFLKEDGSLTDSIVLGQVCVESLLWEEFILTQALKSLRVDI